MQSDSDAVTSSAATSSASLSSSSRAAEDNPDVPVDDGSHAGAAKSKVTAESLGTTPDRVKAAIELLFTACDKESMSGATHPDLWFAHPGFLVCEALELDTSGHDLGAVMSVARGALTATPVAPLMRFVRDGLRPLLPFSGDTNPLRSEIASLAAAASS